MKTTTIKKLASITNRSEGSLLRWAQDIWPDREDLKNRKKVRVFTAEEAEELKRQDGIRCRRGRSNSALYGTVDENLATADEYADEQPEINHDRDEQPREPYVAGQTQPDLFAPSVALVVPDAFRALATLREITPEQYLEQLMSEELVRSRQLIFAPRPIA